MADELKQASQQSPDGAQKGTDETTYPEFINPEKEGDRKIRVIDHGVEKDISFKEAVTKYLPSGVAYTPERQRWSQLTKEYGTEDPVELISRIKESRDGEYAEMLGNEDFHPDFVKVLNEKGFEVVITKRGTGKLVDKSTGEPLSPADMEALDPQTRKLWELQQGTINSLKEELTAIKKRNEESDRQTQDWHNTQQEEKLAGEENELKTKNPDISDKQVDMIRALALIDNQIAFSQTPRRRPKSLLAIYTELNEAFGGKPMTEQDVAKLKAKWVEESKQAPQTEGGGTGSPSPEEKLPQTKKEYYEKMIRGKQIPLNPRAGDY